MSVSTLLDAWRSDLETRDNLSAWERLPARPAAFDPLPDDLPPTLISALEARRIPALYSHQAQAWKQARQGEHVILSTGTASGKTLAYQLPVLAALLEQPQARALFLFPTKALAQDQLTSLRALLFEIQKQNSAIKLQAAIYDGDTPGSQRPSIRKNANIVLSNPDMLHTGILPHHTAWEDFFRGLRYVVIDEMHTYRGVFGSHVANVVRRLKRVARFYGANPQFILTSATIGNPRELAERLVEEPVALVQQDGSARGERHFMIYNPPVVDPALGLRKSALLESVRLSQEALAHGVQGVVFARSRRSVEIILTYLGGQQKKPGAIRGYRSGYLPNQRREIERGLRDGSVRLVVATNALELGIDIGGLETAVLAGYPGTIASTWQQAGRAGRGEAPAVSILVATASPLDQFLAHHPDYLFGRSPENALVNPDHLLILLNHLRCAAFELAFHKGEGFGQLSGDTVDEFLQFLTASQELHFSDERYFWMADAYPAAAVSLRSASPENVVLQTDEDGQPRTVGEVDMASAPWLVHPRAVYMHEGQQYYVQELDLEAGRAYLIPVALDYYTEPRRQTEIQLLDMIAQDSVAGGVKAHGEIQVETQVVGFKKLRWLTHENLGDELLDLPRSEFQTTGYWLAIDEETVENLRESNAWTSDPNQYGPEWQRLRGRVRARDGYRCQVCGTPETDRQHDVHHKVPFRSFVSTAEANHPDNLVTLCHSCHHKVEQNVRMRSGLGGLGYVLGQLGPLFLMCDPGDLGVHTEPQSAMAGGRPVVVLYDQVPAGIGFSQKLFEIHGELMARALELVSECACLDGCPSCVGPGGENGAGGKKETMALLKQLV